MMAYRNLWTDAFYDDAMHDANDRIWSNALKHLDEEIILQAGQEAISRCKYPPSIQEFLEIATLLQRNKERKSVTQKQIEANLSEEPRNTTRSPEAIQSQIDMWRKLGKSHMVAKLELEFAGKRMPENDTSYV